MNFNICFLVFVIYFINCGESINQECVSDDDCSKDKSICIGNVCQCDDISVFSETIKKCWNYATEYADDCFEDEQCIKFLGENGKCKNNKCLCDDGFRWLGGNCIKYVGKGGECTKDDTCLDGNDPLSLTCTDGQCQCSNGYYDRGIDCRIKSQYQKECAIDNDCFPTKFISSYCGLGKCVKNSWFQGDNSTFADLLQSDINDDVDADCAQGVLANLTQEECKKCSNTFYFQEAICICKQGFFLQDGQCIAELGMIDSNKKYSKDSDCPIKPGKLMNGICYCKNYWFQHYTNKECKKTTLQYTYNCMDNDWCKAMGPYAYCDSNTNQCKCIDQAVLNKTTFICELGEKPEGICLEDTDCSLYQQCLNQKCQCIEGFIQSNERCLPKIGASCEIYTCSNIENAVCSSDEICQCASELYVTDGYQCLQVATDLNEECVIEQQCQNIPHSVCTKLENGTSYCLCGSAYFDKNLTCYFKRDYKSQCATKLDCTITLDDSFVCRNSLCQCPIHYTYKNNVCVPNSSTKEMFSYFTLWTSILLLLSIQ